MVVKRLFQIQIVGFDMKEKLIISRRTMKRYAQRLRAEDDNNDDDNSNDQQKSIMGS
jgi:hypothetical protein